MIFHGYSSGHYSNLLLLSLIITIIMIITFTLISVITHTLLFMISYTHAISKTHITVFFICYDITNVVLSWYKHDITIIKMTNYQYHMEISWNGGFPQIIHCKPSICKSGYLHMVLIGFPIVNHAFGISPSIGTPLKWRTLHRRQDLRIVCWSITERCDSRHGVAARSGNPPNFQALWYKWYIYIYIVYIYRVYIYI